MFRILAFISLVLSCHGISSSYKTPCTTGDKMCLLSSAKAGSVLQQAFSITPCKKDDDACLLSTARATISAFVQGVPALGLKTLDPLNLPLINSDHSGLKLQFKNTTLHGLKVCSVESIKNDLSKMKQSITLKCNVMMIGDYKIRGQILILPVEGEGKYKLEIHDMVVKVHVDVESVNLSGVTHWHISKWRQTFKVLTGAKFDFENLFNGNKVLGDPVLQFVNTNWKDIMQEIAPPVVQAIIAKIVEGVEDFYAAVPFNELFTE